MEIGDNLASILGMLMFFGFFGFVIWVAGRD